MSDEISWRHNVEAEQQLLGAILTNNDRLDAMGGTFSKDHFYEPLHAKIFELIEQRVEDGKIASPVSLKADVSEIKGMDELGGPAYLVRLAAASISGSAFSDYANIVTEEFHRRKLQQLALDLSDVVRMPHGIDEARQLMELALTETPDLARGPNTVSFLAAATQSMQMMGEAFRGGVTSIKSGIRDLDDMIGGFFKSDLVIVGGRPSMGKSALAIAIAENVANAGGMVGFASLEMAPYKIADRVLSSSSGVNYSVARQGKVTEAEFRKIHQKAKDNVALPIGFSPPHVRDLPSIRAAMRKIRAEQGRLDLIIVDYLQLVRYPGTRSRFDEVSEVSRGLKEMAEVMEVPVIALAQLSRGVESRDDKRPMLSDLKESGQIEQDADAVLFCYRDHYYLERQKKPEGVGELADYMDALNATRTQMDVLVAKQRMGGIGAVKVGCHLPTNRFWDLDRQTEVDFE